VQMGTGVMVARCFSWSCSGLFAAQGQIRFRQCPLCYERRRYLPSEIFRGKLSPTLGPKPVRSMRL
jgi:hypothetical protein